MIKSLSNITDISVIDQNGANDILTFSKIEFDGNALGSGGFGSVHTVQSVDGISKSEFVLKIFTDEEHKQHAYDVIKLLHEKIKKRQSISKTPVYHDIPELLGLPFIVFKGYDNISEKHCVAFLMYNLEKLSYEDYGSDKSELTEYKSLSIPDKLYLAYQLTKTIEFLHQIEFIHADLSENSLWFNSKRVQLSIIDYDSGYHFDLQGKPTTVGKVGHWIGSTFRNIIGQKKDSSDLSTLDRLYEEYWVLANATFEVIFGVMPFFFLSDTDDNTKQEYLRQFEWPNIDHSSSLFNKANQEQHQAIISIIEQFDNAGASELIDAFKTVFNKGYKNETKRLTSKEWKKLLLKINMNLKNSPVINFFKANKNSISRRGEKVKVSFSNLRYNAIYVNNKLVPFESEEYTLSLKDSSELTLKIVNDFETVTEEIYIAAIKKTPEFKFLRASKLVRDSLDPITLNWEVKNAKKVSIKLIEKKFKSKDSISVEPLSKETYEIKAIGYFDQITSKSITIDVVYPEIKSFISEINLNEGIDNIDLSWNTINTEKVEITPTIGVVDSEGLIHVSIQEITVFKIIAKGLFSEVTKEIIAKPFPVPIIKSVFVEIPTIKIENTFDSSQLAVPADLLKSSEFNMDIDLNNPLIIPKISEKLRDNSLPKFQLNNEYLERYSTQENSLREVFDNVKKTIRTKLKIYDN